MLLLSEGREEEGYAPLYKDYFSNNYMNVFLNQYELSLGEFDTEDRFISATEGGDTVAWICFIGATMIT